MTRGADAATSRAGPGRVVRVVPDVSGLDREFDYSVPGRFGALAIGDRVRVPLHGRRVAGWVVDVDPATGHVGELKDVTKRSGAGPSAQIVELANWAARRWYGRRRSFLSLASPERVVTAVPPPRRRDGGELRPISPATSELLREGGGVLRLPPTADPMPAISSAVSLGPTIVVVPALRDVALGAARLRRAGLAVAEVPDEWAPAAGGVDVVIGTRVAVWAPCPDLAAIVVVDEHDEALQSESAPTWHARDVALERGRRAGAPVVLLSPCPTVDAIRGRIVVRPPAGRERRGWPIVEVIDRRDEEPWKRSLLTSRLIHELRRPDRRVACVINTTGRARLLACRNCRALVRCERCDAAMSSSDGGFQCPRCGLDRAGVCSSCGRTSFANLRPGVARLREELEAAAGRPVASVTGEDDRPPSADVDLFVGTEALLHRLGPVDAVVFLDLDRELLAPRYRAADQAFVLLVRAARLVGDRARGGRVLLQTFLPDHPVVLAAVLADPGRLARHLADQREVLRLPPFGALARVSGPGASEFTDQLAGVEVGGSADARLVRAPDWDALADALAAVPRPAGRRAVVHVDPAR